MTRRQPCSIGEGISGRSFEALTVLIPLVALPLLGDTVRDHETDRLLLRGQRSLRAYARALEPENE